MEERVLGIDQHCAAILAEYDEFLPVFVRMQEIVTSAINSSISERNLYITALESRIKSRDSLTGKLRQKGYKYSTISDLTDIFGARVITFYSDEVDKIAAVVESLFDVDWANSVDKRKMHELNSFGYMSLHYICRIPKTLFSDPSMPKLNELRFEVQMRTALQHVWANMYHDTGYKVGVEVPQAHLRMLNCMAGMLELVDVQFSRIRTEINDYKRRVRSLVSSGNFSDVELTTGTFESYLELKPFEPLISRIASINQAEIYRDSIIRFAVPLKMLGFESLGDIEKLIRDYSEEAFSLALHQIGGTDVDILAASVALQNLCIVHILKNGGGKTGLENFFKSIGRTEDASREWAERTFEQAGKINLI